MDVFGRTYHVATVRSERATPKKTELWLPPGFERSRTSDDKFLGVKVSPFFMVCSLTVMNFIVVGLGTFADIGWLVRWWMGFVFLLPVLVFIDAGIKWLAQRNG